jgi:hypothetical protein
VFAAAAERVGLCPDPVGLFSPEAYLLQGALAAAVVRDLGPPDPTSRSAAGKGVRSQPGPVAAPWTPAHGAALLAAPVLALNFDVIPRRDRPTVRRQLEQVAAFGPSLRPGAPDPGPQVLVGFYDGFRDEGLWGAQVCAELGLTAWFFPLFVPVDGDGAAAEEGGEPLGPLELLTADDLAQIGRVHEIGLHSASYRRAADLGPADLQKEVHEPLDAIAAAWRRGTRFNPDNLADQVLRERGVTHVVSNWSVEAIPPAG